jgi:hypothetical protein
MSQCENAIADGIARGRHSYLVFFGQKYFLSADINH